MGKLKLETISNYAIMLTALIALFISIWQINITHKHNKLSVKPYLDYHLNQTDSILTVNISNEGFGPAIVKDINFVYKGNEYDSLEELLKSSGEIKNRIGSFQYSKNSVLPAGETKLLVKLKNRQLRGVSVNILYETIYEDQDVFSFNF